MPLRDYQQAAVDAALNWINRSIEPALLELATGAGKSHIIAALAHWLSTEKSRKVLCLAPSKELTEQNHEKYLSTGEPASIYSASIRKCLKHSVVFGTPKTVKNSIKKFGSEFALIIIDEAHGITQTIKDIIEQIKKQNPNVRVLGLTATPYRLTSGYIYAYDVAGEPMSESVARLPFFNTLLCRVTPHDLLERGFLTPVVSQARDGYDASELEQDRFGRFDPKQVEKTFEGKGRLTSQIVRDIVESCHGRRGVIIFAATRQHMREVLASLPQDNARAIDGETNKKEREQIISDFKAMRFKYLVNVAVLTTGFDAPHVDCIAILRATESAGLLQQIIGRGMRLEDDKKDCLVLDYADNISNHSPHGDVFDPIIKPISTASESEEIDVICPMCQTTNKFSAVKNNEGYLLHEHGYFTDLLNMPILLDNGEYMPSHHGRRCYGQSIVKGEAVRCDHRWASKECDSCGHLNDITARHCEQCKHELIDPNEKLSLEIAKFKKNPYTRTVDKVLAWQVTSHISQRGNETVCIAFTTEFRTFKHWFMPAKHAEWVALSSAVFNGRIAPDCEHFMAYLKFATMPTTVTVKRINDSKFYTIYAFNQEPQE